MQTSIKGLIEEVKRANEPESDEERLLQAMRKVVSVRLDASQIFDLEQIAKKMGMSRSGAAEHILEVAIHEMKYGLGIVGPFMTNCSLDAEGKVTVSAEGFEDLVVQDDALQIGGGDL